MACPTWHRRGTARFDASACPKIRQPIPPLPPGESHPRVDRGDVRLYAYSSYRGKLAVGLVMLIGRVCWAFFPCWPSTSSIARPRRSLKLLAMAGILLVQATCPFSIAAFHTVGEFGLSDLRRNSRHLTEMPMTFSSQQQVGELTSRMFADLTQCRTPSSCHPQFLRQSVILSEHVMMSPSRHA